MKFNVKALALAFGILYGAAVLVVGLVNLICGGYGQHLLEMLSSCYPGYHATRSIVQVVIVTLYAAADGLIGGAVFGWLYNWLAKMAWLSQS
jgi:membrane associated rhomboid family serine protease